MKTKSPRKVTQMKQQANDLAELLALLEECLTKSCRVHPDLAARVEAALRKHGKI